jgi:hypothetical protein
MTHNQRADKRPQGRTRQLQLIAEIGQATGAYFNVDELLSDTVNRIRDQLGFYHISIFLLNADDQNLILEEATGEIGQMLKQDQFTIPFRPDTIIGWVAN